MECCKGDAYDMGKHSRLTPRLPHIIFHLFTFYVFNLLSVRLSFTRVLACFRLFMNNCFEFTVLCWYTCLVNVSRDVPAGFFLSSRFFLASVLTVFFVKFLHSESRSPYLATFTGAICIQWMQAFAEGNKVF